MRCPPAPPAPGMADERCVAHIGEMTCRACPVLGYSLIEDCVWVHTGLEVGALGLTRVMDSLTRVGSVFCVG